MRESMAFSFNKMIRIEHLFVILLTSIACDDYHQPFEAALPQLYCSFKTLKCGTILDIFDCLSVTLFCRYRGFQ